MEKEKMNRGSIVVAVLSILTVVCACSRTASKDALEKCLGSGEITNLVVHNGNSDRDMTFSGETLKEILNDFRITNHIDVPIGGKEEVLGKIEFRGSKSVKGVYYFGHGVFSIQHHDFRLRTTNSLTQFLAE
jgi:hypothetical protein